MDALLYLILLALQGLFIGAFARLALPGKDPLSLLQTMAIGLVGSFMAGVIFYAAGGRGVSPFLVALVFSTLIVYVIRRRRGGGLTSPSATDPRTPGPYER
jgi:uncharacterized membrane protein YeaQ/YmgE (transglycosylase-associated protein family)